MFIMVGDNVSVENLLKGIIIASGNDACVALAEGIAGTEEEFAILMTTKAKKLEWKILILPIHQVLIILIIIQQ
jgi:D-alanyl-D-alanine carboxypeptidase (penicillin-binding protein 5/6)